MRPNHVVHHLAILTLATLRRLTVLLRITTRILLILCPIALSTMWIISYWRTDIITYKWYSLISGILPRNGEIQPRNQEPILRVFTAVVTSGQGGVRIRITSDKLPAFVHFQFHGRTRPILTFYSQQHAWPGAGKQFFIGVGPEPAGMPDYLIECYRYRIEFPIWLPTLLSSIALALWVRRYCKHRKRVNPEMACPTCAYDLRAHNPGDKCPECDTPIAVAGKAPQVRSSSFSLFQRRTDL